MPSVDVIDEIFVVAAPDVVRRHACDNLAWAQDLSGVTFSLDEDRGREGLRWRVAGDLVGTAEVWLQEHGDGTIVHTYLRAEPVRPVRRRARWARQVRDRYALPVKRRMMQIKDALEAGRPAGVPRVPPAQRVVSLPARPGRAATSAKRGAGRRTDEGAGHGGPDDLQHPGRG